MGAEESKGILTWKGAAAGRRDGVEVEEKDKQMGRWN